MIRMNHPASPDEEPAVTSEQAFEEVWSQKGWVRVEDAPPGTPPVVTFSDDGSMRVVAASASSPSETEVVSEPTDSTVVAPKTTSTKSTSTAAATETGV